MENLGNRNSPTQFAIHEGIWRDYDRTPADRMLLTVRKFDASIILQLLVLVVVYAGSRSWAIWQVICHRIFHRTRQESTRPGIGRQTQVLLRNAGSPLQALIDLVLLFFRNSDQPVISKASIYKAGLLIFLILHAIAFPAAGLAVAFLDVGNAVRSAHAPTCGKWFAKWNLTGESIGGLNDTESFRSFGIAGQLAANRSRNAENYVRNCYYNNTNVPYNCSLLADRALEQMEFSVPCPFTSGICSTADQQAFELNSGNISFAQLGLNIRYANSLSVQRRSVCSTIQTDPFIYDNATKRAWINNQSMTAEEEEMYYSLDKSDYLLRSEFQDGPMELRHEPLRTRSKEATLSIFELHSFAWTLERHFDPWFNFSSPRRPEIDSSTYEFPRFLSVVACEDTIRLCSKVTETCIPYYAVQKFLPEVPELLLGNNAKASDILALRLALLIVNSAIVDSAMYLSVGSRGYSALQASHFLYHAQQTYLHPEQWKVELRHWFLLVLARLQLSVFDFAQAPPELNVEDTENVAGKYPELRLFCELVKFHSSEHRSLSVAGLIVVLVITAVLTLASLYEWYLPESWIRKAVGPKRREEWKEDEVLSLLCRTDEVQTFEVEPKGGA